MKDHLARYWWVFLLRGIFGIAMIGFAFRNRRAVLA
jgi:hypothetical protein